MMIYIPSRSRFRTDLHHTIMSIQQCAPIAMDNVVLVVPENQLSQYQPVAAGFRVQLVGCPVSGIGPTRQWILELDDGDETVMMIDDDMKFFRRIDPTSDDEIGLRPLESGELDKAFSRLFNLLDEGEYAHATMMARFHVPGLAKRRKHVFDECNRANNFHVLRRDVLKSLGIKFTNLDVMEDFFVTLSLISLGYPNYCMTEFVWNQRGSGFEGGCSDYRDGEMQDASAKKLYSLFPEVVEVVEKGTITPGAWKGMGSRTDVRVQWKKALGIRQQ